MKLPQRILDTQENDNMEVPPARRQAGVTKRTLKINT